MPRYLALLALAACQPAATPRAVSAPAPQVAIATVDAAPPAPPADAEEVDDPDTMDPSQYLIRKAFHHRFPVLPMVSADGKHVAVDRSYGLGGLGWEVWKYEWYGADGKLEDTVAVTDETVFHGEPPPLDVMTARAASVWKKLEGFRPMEKLEFDSYTDWDEKTVTMTKTAKIGTMTLFVVVGVDKVTATWSDAKGKVLRKETIDHSASSTKGSCFGAPKPAGFYVDRAHQRIAYEIGFMGNDSCNDDQHEWRVF